MAAKVVEQRVLYDDAATAGDAANLNGLPRRVSGPGRVRQRHRSHRRRRGGQHRDRLRPASA